MDSFTPTVLQRTAAGPSAASPNDIRLLQQTMGNRRVSRWIQTKLMVGGAGDRYEQEADRVARQVVSQGAASGQRAVEDGQPAAPTLQRQGEGMFAAGADVEARLAAQQGGGNPLDAATRAELEPRFGADFSGVRIHTDSESAQLNRSLSAQAFTHGKDIYMGEGKYNPGDTGGKLLLAHELTHVIQQTGAGNAPAQVQTKPLAQEISRRNDGGAINRWDDFEHKAFGDLGAQMAMQHDWNFRVQIPEKTHWFWKNTPAHESTVDSGGFGVGKASDQYRWDPKDQEMERKYAAHQQRTANIKDQLVDGLKDNNKLPTQNTARDFDDSSEDIGITHHPSQLGYASNKHYMSVGDASMLSGDFYKYAESSYGAHTKGLEQAETVNPAELMKNLWSRGNLVAVTNANHFFPLAEKEFRTHYDRAIGRAAAAQAKYKTEDKKGGDAEAEKALLNVGFALHFLQDSFASGHQYPRAMEEVGSALGASGGLAYWGSTANSYHDALCALPKGLPIRYDGGSKNFHGDDFATGADHDVAVESYHALGKILETITGLDYGIRAPAPGQGPDMNKIMAGGENAEARTIWLSMMSHLEERSGLLPATKDAPDTELDDLGNEIPHSYSTSAETPYLPSDISDGWNRAGGRGAEGQRPGSPKERMVDVALDARSRKDRSTNKKSETDLAREGRKDDGRYVDISAPDRIATIAQDGLPTDLTHNETVLVMGALITARNLSREHQRLVNDILAAQTQLPALHAAIKEIGFKNIWGQLADEAEKHRLLEVLAGKEFAEADFVDFLVQQREVPALTALTTALQASHNMGRVSDDRWENAKGLVSGGAQQAITEYLAGRGRH